MAAEALTERESPAPLPPLRQIATGEDELVDGWPRWLVNNIPRDVLAGLVPKSADSYIKIDKVGQGTYSNVYKAKDRDSGKIVALKKVRFDTAESESVKFMAREIMILQKLDHPNVLKLEGLATSRMHYSLYLVFDFMQSDLTTVISHPGKRLTEPQIKCYMHQLLSGLQHCHERGILHRDIKGSNLLIDKDGVLKIGDFGLANYFNPKKKRPLTNKVVTLWYRAPELLLGCTDYGVAIDLWSTGCLLAEMFFGRPIMRGRTEIEQLHKIFKLCGSPSGEYWKRFKLSENFQQTYKPTMLEAFKDLPLSSRSLIMVLLALEPFNRGTAEFALQSEFFSTNPLACDLSGLPILPIKEVVEKKEKKWCVSLEPKKQQFEELHDKGKLDQAANSVNIYSPSSKENERPQLLQHDSTTSNFSSTKPKDYQTSPHTILCSSSLKHRPSIQTDSHPLDPQLDAVCNEHPKKSANLKGSGKRSSSSSSFSRFSGDQIPKH